MNGELQQLYDELSKDLLELKVRYEERWNAHDNRAGELLIKVEKIYEEVKKLPCAVHVQRMNGHSTQLKLLWFIIIGSGILSGIFLWIK